MEDEQALDFDAAERDWKTWAQKADDKAAANLDLADFYERRLKPQEELAALEAVGQAPASPRERWTAAESQQSWKAWERTLDVVDRYRAAARGCAARSMPAGSSAIRRNRPSIERELAFDLAGKDFAAAIGFDCALPQGLSRRQALSREGRGAGGGGARLGKGRAGGLMIAALSRCGRRSWSRATTICSSAAIRR